jgi:hypothetical protein
MPTITTTRSIRPDQVEEAKRDLDKLNNPANLITFNDGWFSKSLAQKWGMSPSELERLVNTPAE